jgi:hypothetical protein
VTLSGAASATTTADSSGAYSFTGLANGTYTLIPSHAGYVFSPGSKAVTVNLANVTGVNFTATGGDLVGFRRYDRRQRQYGHLHRSIDSCQLYRDPTSVADTTIRSLRQPLWW